MFVIYLNRPIQFALHSLLFILNHLVSSIDSELFLYLYNAHARGRPAIDYYVAAPSTSKHTSLLFSKNNEES